MSDENLSRDPDSADDRAAAQAELDQYLAEIGARIGCIRTADGQPPSTQALRAILRTLQR